MRSERNNTTAIPNMPNMGAVCVPPHLSPMQPPTNTGDTPVNPDGPARLAL